MRKFEKKKKIDIVDGSPDELEAKNEEELRALIDSKQVQILGSTFVTAMGWFRFNHLRRMSCRLTSINTHPSCDTRYAICYSHSIAVIVMAGVPEIYT